MNGTAVGTLIGGFIGSGSTLVGAVLAHRLASRRERKAAAAQGLREMAVVRLRMSRRDELEFEADLATLQYQWTVAGVAPAVIATYLTIARHGAKLSRSGIQLGDKYLAVLTHIQDLAEKELREPARGRSKSARAETARALEDRLTAAQGSAEPPFGGRRVRKQSD